MKSVDPLYQTFNGVSVQDAESLILFLVVVGVIGVVAAVSGRRGFCHYLCWMAPFMIMGRGIRNVGGWFSLRLVADASRCVDCLGCSRGCPMSLEVNAMVKGRCMENRECVLCGTCVDACPSNVLSFSYSASR